VFVSNTCLKHISAAAIVASQVEAAGAELEELRELKEDVERRERAQAAVIEHQAKRLDELETLYKVGREAAVLFRFCQGFQGEVMFHSLIYVTPAAAAGKTQPCLKEILDCMHTCPRHDHRPSGAAA
jgi:hypothetical protein